MKPAREVAFEAIIASDIVRDGLGLELEPMGRSSQKSSGGILITR
jgi:hypothetical protein